MLAGGTPYTRIDHRALFSSCGFSGRFPYHKKNGPLGSRVYICSYCSEKITFCPLVIPLRSMYNACKSFCITVHARLICVSLESSTKEEDRLVAQNCTC